MFNHSGSITSSTLKTDWLSNPQTTGPSSSSSSSIFFISPCLQSFISQQLLISLCGHRPTDHIYHFTSARFNTMMFFLVFLFISVTSLLKVYSLTNGSPKTSPSCSAAKNWPFFWVAIKQISLLVFFVFFYWLILTFLSIYFFISSWTFLPASSLCLGFLRTHNKLHDLVWHLKPELPLSLSLHFPPNSLHSEWNTRLQPVNEWAVNISQKMTHGDHHHHHQSLRPPNPVLSLVAITILKSPAAALIGWERHRSRRSSGAGRKRDGSRSNRQRRVVAVPELDGVWVSRLWLRSQHEGGYCGAAAGLNVQPGRRK